MEKLTELLKGFCNENDYSLREDYSGRCMFGKTCLGIVTDDDICSVVLSLADYLRDNGVTSAFSTLGAPAVDDMGLSTIIYFPNAYEVS